MGLIPRVHDGRTSVARQPQFPVITRGSPGIPRSGPGTGDPAGSGGREVFGRAAGQVSHRHLATSVSGKVADGRGKRVCSAPPPPGLGPLDTRSGADRSERMANGSVDV